MEDVNLEQYLNENFKIYNFPISMLKPYENNPRFNEEAVPAVMESIRLAKFKVPIIVDKDFVIICGHTRLKAVTRLGWETVPCIYADDLTPEQVEAFRLIDNKTSELSSWDESKTLVELKKIAARPNPINMGSFGFESVEEMLKRIADQNVDLSGVSNYDGRGDSGSLMEDFIAPPFSILDARQGYWQERKRTWKNLGLKSEIGRDDALLGKGLKDLAEKTHANLNGTSIFDPVLCEIMYRWFCPDGGRVFDCFAGGSVRGVVASYLGYEYTGIELRQEQVDANRENAREIGAEATWYCDDSQNADKYVEDGYADLLFTCPPYADLEQYSDDPRDLSKMEYADFLRVYENIIGIALRKLKNDRFAIFVVGDVRAPDGFYRDFVSDTIRAFGKHGVRLYNQIILIEQLATAPLRARRQFMGLRKVVKTHQNVLVFYKGDPQKIKDNYGEVRVADLPGEDETPSS